MHELYVNAVEIGKGRPGFDVKIKLFLKVSAVINTLNQTAYESTNLTFFIFDGESTEIHQVIHWYNVQELGEKKGGNYLTESCIILAMNMRAFITTGSVIGLV